MLHRLTVPVTLALLLLLAADATLAQDNPPGQRRRREQRQPMTYHVAPDGEDANPGTADEPFASIQKAADTAAMGDTVLIRGGTYGPVKLERGGQYHDRFLTFLAADGEEVIIDGTGADPSLPALFETNGQDYLRIIGITVRNAPVVGFRVNGSWDVTLERCKAQDVAHSGIIVDKSGKVNVMHCEVVNACATGGEETISVKKSQDVNVGHNHVHHTGHEGIDVKEGSKHVRVFNNHVHDVERQALYADSWDSTTSDIRFENNVVHDCQFGIVAGAETSGLLEDVWFVNNLVYNTRGPGMVVQDWGGGGRFTHPIDGVYFINNTVVNNGDTTGRRNFGGGMFFENAEATNIVVRNNIFAHNPQGAFVVRPGKLGTNVVVEHNLIVGPMGDEVGTDHVLADPMFVDPESGDFRLQPGSPAIDAGTSELAPETDIEGKPRPIGAGVDIGAYEHAAE